MKVLNIASFIPVKGLPPENDISLKIYDGLYRQFGVQSSFVKPVRIVPRPFHLATPNVRQFRNIYLDQNYTDEKYNIHVCFYNQGFAILSKLTNSRNAFLIYLQWMMSGGSLINLAEQYQPKLVHGHEIFPSGYYAYKISRQLGMPYILTLRGPYKSESYRNSDSTLLLKSAHAITTPSWALWNELHTEYPIRLIPHGLDDIWFNKLAKKKPNSPLHMISVCRLLEMKNVHLVLKALNALVSNGNEILYTIIGEGPEKKRLQDLVAKYQLKNFVKILGHQGEKEIINELAKAHLFVMLSYPETFGRVYVEAASQGVVPVGLVGTGVYGHFDQRHGFFLDKNKDLVPQLVTLLSEVEHQTIDRMSAACIEKAQEFRSTFVLEQYHALISEASHR